MLVDYLERADRDLHGSEGESTLLEFVASGARRILDLGTGDGRLLAIVMQARPDATAVALDFSPAMLDAVRMRFQSDSRVEVVAHNLDVPLPNIGKFDAVVSSFAIHHVTHERKRELYAEIYESLNAGGTFCNLEHVSCPANNCTQIFFPSLAFLSRRKILRTSFWTWRHSSDGCGKLDMPMSTAIGSGGSLRCWPV